MIENLPLLVATGGRPTAAAPQTAYQLLGSELNGFAIEFLGNTYAIQTATGAEQLVWYETTAMAIDFTDNSYVVKI